MCLAPLEPKDSLASLVRNQDLPHLLVPHPAVPTVDFGRPLPHAFVPLCFDCNPEDSVTDYNQQLVLVIMQVLRLEPDENRHLHTWGDVA